jgi:peroxiredoxin
MTKSSKTMRPVFVVLLVIGGAVALVFANLSLMHLASSFGMSSINVKIGQPALDFSIKDLAGQTVTLNSYRNQKVVLMDFWATWCGPCRMEMPKLQELQNEFKDRGLEILSVNQGEPAGMVSPVIENGKYSFHVVLDQDKAVGHAYGVRAIPTLVLVDKSGVVQWVRVGYSENQDDLRGKVEQLTKE